MKEGFDPEKMKMERLKAEMKKIYDYLEPILDREFEIILRIEYEKKALDNYIYDMTHSIPASGKNINEALKDADVLEKNMNEMFTESDKLYTGEGTLDVKGLTKELQELDKDGEIEKNIRKIYDNLQGVDIHDWPSFIQRLQEKLPTHVLYWEHLKEETGHVEPYKN